MIKLRPHHLLCTQGYSGKGYSREFVENMTEIVKSIKNEKVQVQLIFSEDDICSSALIYLKIIYANQILLILLIIK